MGAARWHACCRAGALIVVASVTRRHRGSGSRVWGETGATGARYAVGCTPVQDAMSLRGRVGCLLFNFEHQICHRQVFHRKFNRPVRCRPRARALNRRDRPYVDRDDETASWRRKVAKKGRLRKWALKFESPDLRSLARPARNAYQRIAPAPTMMIP
jgi:hypothetical protein